MLPLFFLIFEWENDTTIRLGLFDHLSPKMNKTNTKCSKVSPLGGWELGTEEVSVLCIPCRLGRTWGEQLTTWPPNVLAATRQSHTGPRGPRFHLLLQSQIPLIKVLVNNWCHPLLLYQLPHPDHQSLPWDGQLGYPRKGTVRYCLCATICPTYG